jgi:hypothetical protein
MRQNIVDKIAHHIKVRRKQKRCYVDAAVINRRLFILPGETLPRCGRESAEVIIVSSNELMNKSEDSHAYEGLNIKLFPIR